MPTLTKIITNKLILHFKILEKEQTKPNVSRRKKITNFKVAICRIQKPEKSCLFKR